MRSKARTTFTPFRTVKLLSIAKLMSSSMKKSATFSGEWVGCPTNQVKFDEAINIVDQTHLAGLKGDRDTIATRTMHEETLKGQMSIIAHYVSMVANGNEQILRESGVPLLKTGTKTSSAPTTPPVVRLAVKHGGLEGLLLASCARVPGNCSYCLMVSTGDPTVEENWSVVKVVGNASHMEAPNCEPGKKYHFRVQVISPDGVHGPWSQIVSIIAL
jgi:hypothetical protein